jgi:hypothetical protein
MNALSVDLHDACEELEGACPVCLAALERAVAKMRFVDKMVKDCCLEYSVKGDMTILQDHTFICIIFDALGAVCSSQKRSLIR